MCHTSIQPSDVKKNASEVGISRRAFVGRLHSKHNVTCSEKGTIFVQTTENLLYIAVIAKSLSQSGSKVVTELTPGAQ